MLGIMDGIEPSFIEFKMKLKTFLDQGKIEQEMRNGRSYYG